MISWDNILYTVGSLTCGKTDISQPDHLLEDGTGFIKGVRITTHSYAIQYKRSKVSLTLNHTDT